MTHPPVSPADLAGLVELGRPVVSPDGDWAATIHTGPNSVELVVARLDGDTLEHRLSLNAPAAEPCWMTESVLIADGGLLRGLTVSGGATTMIPLPDNVKVRRLAAADDALLMLAERDGHGRLWTVDVDGGAAALDTTVDLLDVAAAPDGRTAVAIAAEPDGEASLVVLDLVTGHTVRTVSRHASRPTTRDRTLEISPDGTRALFSHGGIERGHRPAVVPIAGGPARTLLPDESGTVLAASWSDNETVLAQLFQRTRSILVRVRLADGSVEELGAINTGQPRFSHSRRTGRIVTVDGRDDAAPDLHVWTADGRRRVSDANPWLRERSTAPVTEVTWHSDGTLITGLLVEPARAAPGPMVVNLHGGPHFHWSDGWLGSWLDWAQLLAAEGLAVLLPNPRGSTGRGWGYAHAVRGSLGEAPLRDVLSGVDAMIDRGVADPNALGVGGWSYGGYLTAWAIARTDRFAAAVVGAGITDYYSFIGSSPMGPVWEGFVPDGRFPDRAAFDAVSPVSRLAGCTTPTLVLHGGLDRKVPPHQARILHRALRALDVSSELVIFDEEGHVPVSPAARTELLERTADWFRRHMSFRPAHQPRSAEAVCRPFGPNAHTVFEESSVNLA